MRFLAGAAFLAAVACGGGSALPSSPSAGPPAPGAPVRVLMLTATAGFRHDSIDAARTAITGLGGDIQVTTTEDVGLLTPATLAGVDVVFFALTSGELPLTAAQQAALLAFVDGGGGFLGAHSATDTLYGWPEYGALVGAYFREHPWTRQARVVAEDTAHPVMAGVDASFTLEEEYYAFRENPRPRVQVLLRLDAASVGAGGDYPLAWVRTHGRGRVYYNALGHFAGTWRDARFQRQWRNAIRWAAEGRVRAAALGR
jgi:type 1 glutamine amidotransferase